MSMSIKASPDGTYGEILVNGAVVAKLPVSGNAVIPGLVGTVSESGGVPTGAIIERGSNANGEYVRYADGTQVCYNVNFAAGNGTVWTFPAAFVGTPGTIFGPLAIVSRNVTGATPSTTSQAIYGWNGTISANFGTAIAAYGRWF